SAPDPGWSPAASAGEGRGGDTRARAPGRSRDSRSRSGGVRPGGYRSGSIFSPRYGMNSTAAIHETTSAIVTTSNSERVYSPTPEAAVAIGRKPAAVTRVPVSIGKAVLDQAKPAARKRSKPCSIL